MYLYKAALFIILLQCLINAAKCEDERGNTPIMRWCELFFRHVAYKPRENSTGVPIFDAFEFSAPAEFAIGCLRSVPFDKEKALELINQLRLFHYMHPLQAYMTSHVDVRFGMEPFNLNETFDALELGVNLGDYKDDLVLNVELYRAYAQYKDVNTAFYPHCAMAFTFHHQFPLLAISDNTTSAPKIYLAQFVWSNKTNSFDLIPGERVVKINDQEVVEFLKIYSKGNPDLMFMDHNARWNGLFVHRTPTRMEKYQEYSLGGFAERKTWDEEKFHVTFENGTTEASNWMAKIDPSLHDTFYYGGLPFVDESTYIESFCTPKKQVPVYTESFKLPPYNGTFISITTPSSSLSSDNGLLRAYDVGPEEHGFNMTLVVLNSQFLYNYGDKNISPETLDYFIQLRGWLNAHDPDVKILLDLTSSTNAQKLAIVPQLVHLFFPGADTADKFMSNVRRTALLDTIMRDNAEASGGFEGNTSSYLNNDGIAYASVEEVLNPVFMCGDTFTQFFKKNQTALLQFDVNEEIKFDFRPENMAILTDGICSGVCAAFVRVMEHMDVKTVVVGGMYGSYSMQAAGSQGARPISYDEIIETMFNLNMSQKHGAEPDILNYMPTDLVAKASVDLPMENRFWFGEDKPEEMMWRPAKRHIAYTKEMITDVRELWKEAAKSAFLEDD